MNIRKSLEEGHWESYKWLLSEMLWSIIEYEVFQESKKGMLKSVTLGTFKKTI